MTDGPAPRLAALLLAAGASQRMGGPNKLLATLGGKPLVRIAAEAALASRALSLTVVTGHAAAEVEAALAGLAFAGVHNAEFAAGMSTSLRAGLASLPADVDGAIVLLADMPEVTAATIDTLIAAFSPGGIVVPTYLGRRGNPLIWSRQFFAELSAVTGDRGGRDLIACHAGAVREVPLGAAVAVDVDTLAALSAIGGKPP